MAMDRAHISAQGASCRPEIRTPAGSRIRGSQPTGPDAVGRLLRCVAAVSSATPCRFMALTSPISEYTEITDCARWRRNDSLAGQDQAGDLAQAAPELEEAPEIGDGERAELSVGRIHGLHELEQLAETLLRLGVGRPSPVEQGDTLAK